SDDKTIYDYYDSVSKKKIPKQDWMREKLPSKEQFKVNVDILVESMRHNNTGDGPHLHLNKSMTKYLLNAHMNV
uniref:MHC class I alpha 1 antigen n=1 Tax=Oncorhynchus tshawytscha TaxID=74940 RepID=A0AAZ3QJP7_ONCTS